MKDKKKQNRAVNQALVMVLQLGLNMIIPILLCTIVGFFLAKSFESKVPAIIGILIGTAASVNGAYRYLKSYLKGLEPGDGGHD